MMSALKEDEPMTREIVAWSTTENCPDLSEHETMDEAIQAWIDDQPPATDLGGVHRIDLYLTLYGWARCEWPDRDMLAAEILCGLEARCAEFFDPECEQEWSKPVWAAALALADAIRAEVPWTCEIVETRTVNVAHWAAGRTP